MSLAFVIIVVVICILLEGFFSGSEMALVNADRHRLRASADAGSRGARQALRLVRDPARFFSTTLLGTNLAVVAASEIVSFYVLRRYGEAAMPLALLFAPLPLIFGEIVPKSIYHHYADRIVTRIAPFLRTVSILFWPAVWPLSLLTRRLLRGLPGRSSGAQPVSREALELMLRVGQPEESDVKAVERTMISRIFDLADKTVENIMTPLVDVVAIDISAGREAAARIMEEYEFSRVPVYERRVFNIVGVLTGTDLLFGDSSKNVRELMRAVPFVPEEMPLDELLVMLKRRGEPLAVAVDEYGAATGIATTEDLLEEVVGEIRDEHDEEPPLYSRLGRNRFLVEGRLEIEVANERLKLWLPDGDYETVAGFALHRFERIPNVGDHFVYGPFLFIVRQASERAITQIEIVRQGPRHEGEDSQLSSPRG